MIDALNRSERINELARKKRTVGLTEAEAKEQQHLRCEYLKDFRNGMKQMLESIVIEQPNGERKALQTKSNDPPCI